MQWSPHPHTLRITKRTLLKAALFIVAGAIINVVVAWGLALIPDIIVIGSDHEVSRDDVFDDKPFVTLLEKHVGTIKLLQYRDMETMFDFRGNAFDEAAMWAQRPSWSRMRPGTLVDLNEGKGWPDDVDAFIERAAGWPCFSVRYWRIGQSVGRFGPNSVYDTVRAGGLLTLPESWQWTTEPFEHSHRDIPYLPLWPGFAINTIFYAGILWLLFTAPGFVRRRVRVMRHHCPACAYPIGTNPRCTECGTPLTPSPMQGEGGGVGRSHDSTQAPNPRVYPPPNPLPAREGES